MTPLDKVEGRAIPFGLKNVDTDVIIPAHWLKTTTREGMGRGAFESLRADPDNLFDSADFKGAPILIAGDNFGCGSSREHAAWALGDLGIRVVIDPVFVDLEHQTVTTQFQDRFSFEIDPFRKMCLLEGLDEISLTEKSDAAIGAYEKRLDADRPWMRPAA